MGPADAIYLKFTSKRLITDLVSYKTEIPPSTQQTITLPHISS